MKDKFLIFKISTTDKSEEAEEVETSNKVVHEVRLIKHVRWENCIQLDFPFPGKESVLHHLITVERTGSTQVE